MVRFVTRGVRAPKGLVVEFFAKGKGKTKNRHAWVAGQGDNRWDPTCGKQAGETDPVARFRYSKPTGKMCSYCLKEVTSENDLDQSLAHVGRADAADEERAPSSVPA